jgi:pantoate--beta-alanine ligase
MTQQLTVARTRDELSAAHSVVSGREVIVVMTMGALHAGHLALIRRARKEVGPDGALVVTIFVNPLQFGAGEDLNRYPRTFDADLRLCVEEGVDVVFAPSVNEMYPDGTPQVTVHPGPLGDELEGAVRPGHFAGVLTVVTKLLGLIAPSYAVFGEKDYQQLVLIRRMVTDLELGVRIVAEPTVRESDGLALSSRNAYLDERQRKQALVLHAALQAGVAAGANGADAVRAAASAVLDDANGVQLDYLALRAPDLGPAPPHGEARILIAARVGPTRLIDNMPVLLGQDSSTG